MEITALLDAVYSDPESNGGLDPALASMQWASIRSEQDSHDHCLTDTACTLSGSS
jgi:hypothetical protein